jgi:hypothetical protein
MLTTYVTTPAGPCPIKPNTDLPEEQMVQEWARAVFDYGLEKNTAYQPSAIIYWSRRVWEGDEEKLKIYRKIILKMFGANKE